MILTFTKPAESIEVELDWYIPLEDISGKRREIHYGWANISFISYFILYYIYIKKKGSLYYHLALAVYRCTRENELLLHHGVQNKSNSGRERGDEHFCSRERMCNENLAAWGTDVQMRRTGVVGQGTYNYLSKMIRCVTSDMYRRSNLNNVKSMNDSSVLIAAVGRWRLKHCRWLSHTLWII